MQKTPIAIVGIGGLFPGAPTLDRFWTNVRSRVSASREVPEGRWILSKEDAYSLAVGAADKVYSLRGCFVEDFDFNPSGFALDPGYIERLDPAHHFVLHVAKQAIADLSSRKLERQRTGVVIGNIALPTDSSSALTRQILGPAFEERVLKRPPVLPTKGVEPINRYVAGLPAGVLARALGLGGGAYALDAACASSLYAVKLAVEELRSGRADAMLTGGLSRPDCLYTQMGFAQLRALSPSGVCSPFDAKGDGLVVGEGAGMLVLKRLDDAVRDGDHVYGVIRGIGLSNDIGGSLLAPDSEGQLRAMRQAYAEAGWAPSDVDHVECHATGTPVGDAVEFKSLSALWSQSDWKPGRCVIGSVKSNVGHLLTGAGAAGMIKTLLAMREGVLPPTANYRDPNPNIQLDKSPFRVLTHADAWDRRSAETPRRAAVSAFGFGGINGHVLVEEWLAPKKTKAHKPAHPPAAHPPKPVPVAVIGMDARFGTLKGLREFQEAVLSGKAPEPTEDRLVESWWGVEGTAWFDSKGFAGRSWRGHYLKDVSVPADAFRIPPKELEEMLPQQLLALLSADAAIRDAGILNKTHERTGVFVGMGLDLNANNFHFRWSLQNRAREYAGVLGLKLSELEERDWLKQLRDAFSPPLTANRTMGALASIIASRIAREYKVGGPSFALSSEESSGLKTLEVAVRALQRGDLDSAIVGAVDLKGDARSVLATHADRPYSRTGEPKPFDDSSDGTIPGEGAATVVLKRLEDALKNGDRVYAVIRGVGSASGGGVDGLIPTDAAYTAALDAAYKEAGVSPSTVGYVETHGSGNPDEDRMEAAALSRFFMQEGPGKSPCALGSSKPVIGHAGAAAGMASFVKAALALYQEILPPLALESPRKELAWAESRFHAPRLPQYWFRNRAEGPRRAGVSAFGIDGNCLHVVLEQAEKPEAARVEERRQPLGARDAGLFAVEEDNPPALVSSLRRLRAWVEGRGERPIEALAREWWEKTKPSGAKLLGLAIVALNREELVQDILRAEKSLVDDPSHRLNDATPAPGQSSPSRVFYSPEPLGRKGKTAFVFPGSGNQYIGMGLDIAAQWPEVLRLQDAENRQLKDQFVPHLHVPYRLGWKPGWEHEALDRLGQDHKALIFGQVAHGVMVSDLVLAFGVKPDAVVGYSLGETAGLFAMRAWTDRDEMLRRMNDSTLFVSDLAGPCNAAREYWNLAAHEAVDWVLGVIDRPSETVQSAVEKAEKVFLLIVNTPRECVVGGARHAVNKLVEGVGGTFLPLQGVTTVHCNVAKTVEQDYRLLHVLPTRPPERVRFYSSAWGQPFEVSQETAADAIVAQAVDGIDFTKVVNRAYDDGIRVFIEMGPRHTCARMISKILGDKPHLSRSACVRGQDGVDTVLRLLANLVAERVPLDLAALYGQPTKVAAHAEPAAAGRTVTVPLGRKAPSVEYRKVPALPAGDRPLPGEPASREKPTPRRPAIALPDEFGGMIYHPISGTPYLIPASPGPAPLPSAPAATIEPAAAAAPAPVSIPAGTFSINQLSALTQALLAAEQAKAAAHAQFLKLSQNLVEAQLQKFVTVTNFPNFPVITPSAPPTEIPPAGNRYGVTNLTREECLRFAVGKIGDLLGDAFKHVDDYPARVRLPDEPLMLVDRVTEIEGVPNSMTSGRVVTEHDVLTGAWYLDGGRIPTCIAVEAGQADLFLSGYLGIDSRTKGLAVYRLLDAEVTFHDSLPQAGSVIRYDIRIERFMRQGETYLFFFNFDGTVDGKPLITMRKGCAGFFTRRELDEGKGIVFTELDLRPQPGRKPADWDQFVPIESLTLDSRQVAALRSGDLAAAFGPAFASLPLRDPIKLPGGRMKLVDRVVALEPKGGRYGLGLIRAEADIHPDDWFLTCHFVDDMVMPGTLMYECCMHTLRIHLMRMGWVGESEGAWCEPVPGIRSQLKCRGQVLQSTKKATYEISIKELGFEADGTPFAIADALMYSDEKAIVLIKDMSVRMKGLTREGIRKLWEGKAAAEAPGFQRKPALYDTDKILAFAIGKPSEAFGEPYKPFDEGRVIARLPGPPYQFLDRITDIQGAKPFVLQAGGTIEAQYDVPPHAWYFKANRQASMPFAVLLEVALQPCGWFSSYMGSVLHGTEDLSYRNLGGNAVQHMDVFPDAGTLTTTVKSTKISLSGGMIIQNFDFEMRNRGRLVYKGDTYFGFFTKKALADQVGVLGVQRHLPSPEEAARGRSIPFAEDMPLNPEDGRLTPGGELAMPSRALRMFDKVELFVPDGGPKGLGFIRGVKTVVPEEWFFKAHFYQDPVWPGSLGLEAFLQLLKVVARERWSGELAAGCRFEPIALGLKHDWTYRGQVIRKSRHVEIEAAITEIDDKQRLIRGDGFLMRDGLIIYQMKDFAIRVVPE